MSDIFRSLVPIRFGDCDPAGIVFYPRYFEMSHAVIEDWFEQGLAVDYPDYIGARGLGFPTVAMSTEFKHPSRFGETVDWQLTVPRLGNRSVQLRHEVWHGDQLRLTMDQTCVCLDRLSGRAIAWPDDVKHAINQFIGAAS
jgi:4-hydroxybenzoyl-CoA thioesterase